jgi:hypothetical protein
MRFASDHLRLSNNILNLNSMSITSCSFYDIVLIWNSLGTSTTYIQLQKFRIFIHITTQSLIVLGDGFQHISVVTAMISIHFYYGQYSSDSSKVSTSFLNTFLHFLHANTNSLVFLRGWSSASLWQSAHSNHFLQHAALIAA